jgi:hypothetical protein
LTHGGFRQRGFDDSLDGVEDSGRAGGGEDARTLFGRGAAKPGEAVEGREPEPAAVVIGGGSRRDGSRRGGQDSAAWTATGSTASTQRALRASSTIGRRARSRHPANAVQMCSHHLVEPAATCLVNAPPGRWHKQFRPLKPYTEFPIVLIRGDGASARCQRTPPSTQSSLRRRN